MPKFRDITGERFGRLVVIDLGPPAVFARTGGGTRKSHRWNCVCDCGRKPLVFSSDLTTGKSLSCGCLSADIRRIANTTHGQSGTKAHRAWKQMIGRCENARGKNYHYWGGRGIKVDPRWRADFQAFLDDVGQPPSIHHTLDRENTDGNYEPGNVRWATWSEQQNNRRNNIMVTIGGVTLSISQWAERIGVKRDIIRDRFRRNAQPYEQIIHELLSMPNEAKDVA